MRSRPSHNTKTRWWLLLVGMLPLLGLLGLAGCAYSPVQPSQIVYDVDQGLAAINDADARVNAIINAQGRPQLNPGSGGDGVTYAYDVQPIDDKGFTLTLDMGSGNISTFYVPAGAIDRAAFPNDSVIEIHGWRDEQNGNDTYIYECFPHGLVFKSPIKLHQPLRSNELAAGLFYYNDPVRIWQLEAIGVADDGRTIFEIHHFSKYGVS